MTRAYIPTSLRRDVIQRARSRCEYCRFPQAASLLALEVEHIVAEKHGGATTADNLALACPYCNHNKGSDLGSVDPETGVLTPFFNPSTSEIRSMPREDVGRLTNSADYGSVLTKHSPELEI
jgi:HNH endonuclease